MVYYERMHHLHTDKASAVQKKTCWSFLWYDFIQEHIWTFLLELQEMQEQSVHLFFFPLSVWIPDEVHVLVELCDLHRSRSRSVSSIKVHNEKVWAFSVSSLCCKSLTAHPVFLSTNTEPVSLGPEWFLDYRRDGNSRWVSLCAWNIITNKKHVNNSLTLKITSF